MRRRRWGDRREKGRMGRAWGNGMGEMEEGWIWEQGSRYLNLGSHFRVGKRLDSRGVPRCPRRCPQLVP